MKHNFIILVLGFLLLLSCSEKSDNSMQQPVSNKRLLMGTWQLSGLSKSESKENVVEDKLLKAAQDKEMVKQGLIISFFPDNTFTEVKGTGEYQFGKWNYANKGKSICLIASESKDTIFVGYESQNNQQVMHVVNRKAHTTMDFVKYVDLLDDYTQDPFYYTNNSWRIKATHSETTEELHERLGNYFKHLAYLLHSGSVRKLPSIVFVFSQGIVKIYDGGIGILPMIPETWEKTYFNKEDASIAYQMFQYYLASSNYHGAGTGDWYKDDYDILTSIYGDVKAGKFPKRSSK